jgi:hypothetical protein
MMRKHFIKWKETLVTLDQGCLTLVVSSYGDTESLSLLQLVYKHI